MSGLVHETASCVLRAKLWITEMRIPLLLTTLFLLGVPVRAEEPVPCDPQKTVCYTTEAWVIALRHWTPGKDPEDLAGGRGQAELRYHRLRVAGRLDGTASAGEYKQGDLSTVRDIEIHVAVAYDALRLPGNVTLGPMAALGGAIALPKNGVTASLGRHVTAVLGARASWRGGWAYVGVGAVHPLERGIGVAATWQLKLTERTASVGYAAYGRRIAGDPGRSEATLLVWTGIAVRI